MQATRQAIGYVRVSTEQQADSGLGIEAQRVKLEALATLNDFQLIDVVVDAGASAKSLDRPGWQRVMGTVHGRQVGAVLIAKLDRCTRSVADLASLIDTFSRRGVALISAAESLDTSSAGGRLVVNMMSPLYPLATAGGLIEVPLRSGPRTVRAIEHSQRSSSTAAPVCRGRASPIS